MNGGPAENKATSFDTIIAGGQVLDPATGLDGIYDIGIADGRIRAVERTIPPNLAARVIDARGQIVTPGLVDLHTHVYWGVTYWGIEADPVGARTGVTTWLDAGSAGAYSFPGFRRFIVEASRVTIYAFLNLSVIGLIARTWECANLVYCDVDLAARLVEDHRDVILGIKVRVDNQTTAGVGIRPLALARELADGLRLPLMVHIASGPPHLDDIIPLLRPGDILTHCFTGGTHRIVTRDRRLRDDVRRLRDQGLILDVGHGSGSFSYESAEALLDQGVLPDVISSDIHQLSIQGPMFDLPTTLSKFLNLGMSLHDVIECATVGPARAMRRQDLGTLRPGSRADVALFRVDEGDYTFFDVDMRPRRGNKRLVNTLTLVAGEVLPRTPQRAPQVWATLPEHQRSALRQP